MLRNLLRQLRRPRETGVQSGDEAPTLVSAITLQRAGEHAKAEAVCRALLERNPGDVDVLHLLGSNLLAQEKNAEAVEALRQVTSLDPALAEAHYNLALAQKEKGDAQSALASFRTVLELTPGRVEACIGAGTVLSEEGALDQAEAYFRQAIQRRPDFAEAHYSLGLVLTTLQRFDEAMESYRAALAIAPEFLLAHGNLLFLLNAHSPDPKVIHDEHRAWGSRHADPLGTTPRYSNTPEPGRRLRVGYVSPDFRTHPVAVFVEPILAHHDREAFEVVCYHSSRTNDRVTARLQAVADRWVDCTAWSDRDLAAHIRAERIDILVDLAGHTLGNRLLAFAAGPAPVQVTYLGYPTITGMAAIDYRVTDPVVDPTEEAHDGAEAPVRLPHSYFCFACEEAPLAGHLPAKEAGAVTFGSFNASRKWSDETLALWARVLHALPRARLLLKTKDLSMDRVCRRVRERLEAFGIDGGRVALQGWAQTAESHLSIYGQVDIALDTYPYNGATTTCEALWMGVPVVTLKGATHASRMAASILAATGLHELVADTPEKYVEICIGLASNLERLESMRAGLRERLHVSPLMDGAAFTKALESEYRSMWHSWCRAR